MTLDALKDIRISSSEGKLVISAKQEIILTSGGGYIRTTDVDHEGAYAVGDTGTENGLSVAMKFTLRSIIKMAGEVTSCG
ncbi:DUF2345 domain-containing protein [Pectobacterium odoriferum]|nr:DUF2345 domain-containing protein [Pectobacterium odoriferum]QHP81172.1 DUF2345 domain-containing protein [Pectobacterium odoriferum]GKW01191.1 hypothetical protein PEC301877_00060 [Pectobacterium carotovorum subsp. carotovorum]